MSSDCRNLSVVKNDYHIRVVTDAVAGSSKEAHDGALRAIRYLQRDALITTADVESALINDVFE